MRGCPAEAASNDLESELAGDVIDFARSGRVAHVWLNRPHKRNAINMQVLDALSGVIDEVEADAGLGALVLRGRGGTFCSGYDLDELRADFLGDNSMKVAVLGAKVCEKLSRMRKPSLAVLEGHVTAGGFEFMLACDFAIATDDARIGDFHIRRALIGGAGPIYRLPRIIGIRRAKELMLTGKLLSGTRAAEWGLVNEAVPAEALDAAVDAFVSELVDKSPTTLWVTKMTVDRSLDADTESLMVMEHLAAALVMKSSDAMEGVAAFLEKRQPEWKAL